LTPAESRQSKFIRKIPDYFSDKREFARIEGLAMDASSHWQRPQLDFLGKKI